MKSKPVVLYHKNCLDGFTGAWIAWKTFGSGAEYIGLEHQESPPKGLKGRELIFIDFCYPQAVMKKITRISPHVTMIDHHISQKEAVKEADVLVYDMDHSGCMLAWKFFYPNEKPPHFLMVVEDNDLHRFNVPHTREFIAVLGGILFSFKTWSRLVDDFENVSSRKDIVQHGKILLEHKKRIIDRTLLHAEPIIFEGQKTFAINTFAFYSDAACAIYERMGVPIGISWFYKDGKIHVSLRSNGSVDVSKMAQKYGGGGHVGAAGFSFPVGKLLPWKRIK